MILELVKKASAQDLSLSIKIEDGKLSISCVDSNDKVLYSYEAIDKIEVMNMINEYVTDPVTFTKRFTESAKELELVTVSR